ncbi:cell division protein FtsA [Aminivibrio sp.]|uniref:cell division protein FtsA n=1 Tax=Aminivibrio sp. TaxID=1872489 RepID=UPI0016A54541|nr:cell division protein FtsA [Synergistaceae bacterium]MDD3391816.1 cell division protein FtsA [Synergistaceae bacterium]MDD4020572.1 cell division protein FtsA [Synergistaceae bacterium]MDD4613177.1 cell division protein FtsA [Synergistaceae bacterium]NLO59113.1 cell division protein FtsA [Synergistaceae bacterium]
MYKEPEILVGLDLGTSKIAVVVAERDSRFQEAQIIGVGYAPSQGIRKGLIINLEQAVRSVRHAVKDAENMVGFEISEATVSFSGIDVASVTSRGMISLGRTPRQVSISDVERVIEAAQSELSIPSNRVTLHTIPVKYSIDGNSGIDDPLGMTGIRLEMELQSVIIPTTVVQNIINCVETAGVEVNGLVIKSLASALGALTDEETRAGVISLCIGGGTTGVALYTDGRPVKLSIIPIGGDHITNDLAYVMKIPISKAEEIKKMVSLAPEGDEEELDVDVRGKTKTFNSREASEVVNCRLEELFGEHVIHQLSDYTLHMFPAGVVLSGGVAKTPGVEFFASELLNLPVRIAEPLDMYQMPPGRNDCEYTTVAGIVRYMTSKERNPYRFIETPISQLRSGSSFGPLQPPPGKNARKPANFSREGFRGVVEYIKKSVKELF